MTDELLIIFVKNPALGKVKSRLAQTIGEENALAVYFKLLSDVCKAARPLPCDKAIYYSDFIDKEDNWDNNVFQKHKQADGNIGVRMYRAIAESLARGYSKVALIGSDIYGLSSGLLLSALDFMDKNDVVLGPARDGGYYLVGLKENHPKIFNLSKWSTSTVLKETIQKANELKLSLGLLQELKDIDTIEDLRGTPFEYYINSAD